MTLVTNNILVVACSANCAQLVQEAFQYVHVEQLSSVKDAMHRMRKDPPIHALLLDFKSFDPKHCLTVLQSFQKLFPDVPIVVINHSKPESEHDSEVLIQYGAQDVINMPCSMEMIQSTIIRSIARHKVRREFEPLEEEIGRIKSDVELHGKDFITKCENCTFVPKQVRASLTGMEG